MVCMPSCCTASNNSRGASAARIALKRHEPVMYIQRGAPQAAIGRQIPHHQSEGVDAPLCEGRCGQPRLDTFSVMGGLC